MLTSVVPQEALVELWVETLIPRFYYLLLLHHHHHHLHLRLHHLQQKHQHFLPQCLLPLLPQIIKASLFLQLVQLNRRVVILTCVLN